MGHGLLCEELLEEIFSRLPLTCLIKCKYVSKSWSCLASNVCCRGRPTVGLIGLYSSLYPYTSVSSELRLLHPPMKQEEVEEEEEDDDDAKQTKQGIQEEWREKECIMETTKCLTLDPLTDLLDSCNGLILCRCSSDRGVNYYIGNPIVNQWSLLPHSPKQDYYATIGFAFDGIQGHHYKILHLFSKETTSTTNRIQCQIFSSETGQWKEHQALTVLNSLSTLSHCIKLIRGSIIQKHGFYRNGALHWTFTCDHKYMLVFYVEKEVFRFIELPGDLDLVGSNDKVAKCLWESKGYLHYAVTGKKDVFQIWKNMNHDGGDDKQHRWVRIRTVIHKSKLPENLKDPNVLMCIYYRCSWSIDHLCVPNELNDGSRVVNLGTILSYFSNIGVIDDETSAKRLMVRWMLMSRKDGRGIGINVSHLTGTLYPYVFNLIDLPIWDGCTLLKHPN